MIEAVPAAPLPGQLMLTGVAPASELHIDLAPGVKEPIALVESTADLSTVQARVVTGIADDFIGRIEGAAESLSDESFSDVWDAGQASADSQYYALFGAEAYNRKLADTAANAVAGRPVEPNAPAPLR